MRKIIIVLLLCSVVIYSKEIYPLKDIKAGQKAIGKTVINGIDIEEFSVEILGVLKNSKINDSLIINGNSLLVKVSGDVIEKSGGIAAGMSGSPVYIDNKIVGALSSGWLMTDHTVGMVTPIEDMKKLIDYPKSYPELGSLDLIDPIKVNNRTYYGISYVEKKGYLTMKRVNAPLIVSNVNNRTKKRLQQKLNADHVVTFEPSENIKTKGELKEGSAISVQLARGDVNISTIGTLTYIDKNDVLAFGHSFLKSGNVNYFLSEAYIYHCFSSINMPFKVGVPTKLCGMIIQDREQGIYGVINKFPMIVPVRFSVKDNDIKVSKDINIQVVSNNDIINSLSDTLLTQSIDGVLNRIGKGTAKISYSIEYETENFKNYVFKRENVFYCNDDVANGASEEFGNMLDKIIENDFEKVRIKNIFVEVELTKERKTAILTDVMIDRKEITLGENLSLILKIKPYRKAEYSKKLELFFDDKIKTDQCKMIVRSGSFSEEDIKPDKKVHNSKSSLEEYITELSDKLNNNEIVISFYDNSSTVFFKKKISLPYSIEGYFDYEFNVNSKKGSDNDLLPKRG